MTPELAAKLEASRCRMTSGGPVHLTMDAATQLLEQRERVRDTLEWLRGYLTTTTAGEAVTVPARDVWNRLSMNYFSATERDPDELPAEAQPQCWCNEFQHRPHPPHLRYPDQGDDDMLDVTGAGDDPGT